MDSSLDTRLASVLRKVDRLAPGSYVVGGVIRDRLMRKPPGKDLDLAVAGDGFRISKEIASVCGITFVPLDESHGSGRIVLTAEDPITVDIISFKGPDILADLKMRDFTINALAVSLVDFLEGRFHRILDPTSGSSDIAAKTLRMCSDSSYRDDALRILRLFRFMASLGFSAEQRTLALIPEEILRLSSVAPERIRDEFMATLSADSSVEALNAMDATGVLVELFPELEPMRGCSQNDFHHLDVWDHSIEAVRQLERIINDWSLRDNDSGPLVLHYLSGEPVKGRSRKALLKLAALFHDSGKPRSRFVEPGERVRFFGHEKISREIFEQAAERLRLAKREIALAGDLVEGHMRPMIFTLQPVSRRAVLRMYRRFHKDIVGLFLLFLADLAATRGPARTAESERMAGIQVLRALEICLEAEETKAKPFLNGRDIMELFGLEPGPRVGLVLKHLKELQDLGDITDKEQAVEAAREMLQRS